VSGTVEGLTKILIKYNTRKPNVHAIRKLGFFD
jgi:hypothetical protein